MPRLTYGRVTMLWPAQLAVDPRVVEDRVDVARAMNARYVRFTFCAASSGLSFARSATTRAMSTSIALVTCAAVSTERRMCSITPRRIAVIGSSASPGRELGLRRRGCRSRHRRGRRLEPGRVRARAARPEAAERCDRSRAPARPVPARRQARGLPRQARVPEAAHRRGAGAGAGDGRRRWGGGGTGLDEVEDVLLRHATAGPGARDDGRVDPVLGGDARDDRGDEGPSVAGRLRAVAATVARRRRGGQARPARRGLLAAAGAGAAATGSGRGRRLGAAAQRAAGARLGGRDLRAGRRDEREDRSDLDRLALLHEDLRDDALAGLGTSVSTLSVEISSSGSSRPIASPTCLSHFVTVPSETETPIWGITTSVCVPVDTVPPTSRRRALSGRSRRLRPAG